ncbi:MAG: site-2 protease family protein [Chloroflexota bacterium]|nr:site-2 protease family protein [Chloroflexota bacterium]
MNEQTIVALIAVAVVILVGFPVHEFSHAWAAFRLGDSTARYQGRLTLDPRVHFDPVGGLILAVGAFVGFFIGWARPTPVNPYNLQYGRRGEALVAAAGPVSNLVMASVVAIPVRLLSADPQLLRTLADSLPGALVYNVAWYFVLINALLFIFNLLPIPPLDGWKILTGLVDARLAYSLRQIEPYGIFLLLALVLVGGRFIGGILGVMVDFFLAGAPRLPLAL